jgi:hypothetical protein
MMVDIIHSPPTNNNGLYNPLTTNKQCVCWWLVDYINHHCLLVVSGYFNHHCLLVDYINCHCLLVVSGLYQPSLFVGGYW